MRVSSFLKGARGHTALANQILNGFRYGLQGHDLFLKNKKPYMKTGILSRVLGKIASIKPYFEPYPLFTLTFGRFFVILRARIRSSY